ncbi:MAG: flagellar biogenesis protein FliO [Planctomycetota bacterium]|jgi:flagellar biogenesis protein FliO
MSIPTLCFLTLSALGENTVSTAVDPGPDLNQYLLISAGMVILVGGIGWFFQRTMSGSIRARANKRSLRVLDVLPMGGKKKLAVVRVYDRTFVLGLGDKEISIVSELDPSVPVEELTPTAPQPKSKAVRGKTLTRAFEAIRARVAEGIPRPQPAAEASAPTKPTVHGAIQAAVAAKTQTPQKTVTPRKSVTSKLLSGGRGLLG